MLRDVVVVVPLSTTPPLDLLVSLRLHLKPSYPVFFALSTKRSDPPAHGEGAVSDGDEGEASGDGDESNPPGG